ncbi:MAG: hypothetical protein U0R66_17545 [Mycobacterium sp.]
MSIHRRLTSLRRTSSTMISLGVMNLAAAPPALADVGTLALASWINVTDSQGVPVGAYGLSLDNGSLTNPTAGATSLITHWLYGIFQTIIGLALWLVDNVLSFEWLDVLARPLNDLGPKLTAVALHPYLIVAIGTIAAVIIALNMVRGRVSKAGAQIGTATVLALLAVTLANKPLAELIGSGGLLAQGRDIGLQLATALSPDNQAATGPYMVHRLSANLADHFARTPTMVWNFGADLDGPSYHCGNLWSAAIKAGDLDKVKDAVTACPNGKALHAYAIDAAGQHLTTGFMALIFALAVLVVFGYLCYHVVILALSALFWALVAVFAAVAGLIPGPAQTLAVKAALDAIFSWLGMAIYVAVVGVVGALSAALFNATSNSMVAMPLVTMLLIAVFFALRRVRAGLVSVRDNAAHKTGALGKGTSPAGAPLAPAAESSPGHLDRLDPLTSVPALTSQAGHHSRRAGKTALTTAGRVGRLIVAPEAAVPAEAGSAARKVTSPKKRSGTTTSGSAPSPTQSDPATRAAPTPTPTPTQPHTRQRPPSPTPSTGPTPTPTPTRPQTPGAPAPTAPAPPTPRRPGPTPTPAPAARAAQLAATPGTASPPEPAPPPTPMPTARPAHNATPSTPQRPTEANRATAVHPALLQACADDSDTTPTPQGDVTLLDGRLR